jgi:single-strand DNA-binding protein
MSRGVNRVHLIGNVGNDPEIRATSGGTRVAKLSLATGRYKDDKTDWHRVTFFGKVVDVVEQYVKKGDRIYVEGRIEYSQTESDNGPKFWTDIVANELTLLGSKDGAKADKPDLDF